HQRNKSRPTAPTSESPAVITSGTNSRQTTPATSKKSTSSLPNRNVDDTEVVQLQARIVELQKDNQKLQSQNAALSGELDKLCQENEALIFINGEFGKE
ncbi:13202_t:CDS:2, partial [Funneliformis caledonium]